MSEVPMYMCTGVHQSPLTCSKRRGKHLKGFKDLPESQGQNRTLAVLYVPSREEKARGKIYRGTSLTRKCTPLGPYRRPMPRVLGGS